MLRATFDFESRTATVIAAKGREPSEAALVEALKQASYEESHVHMPEGGKP